MYEKLERIGNRNISLQRHYWGAFRSSANMLTWSLPHIIGLRNACAVDPAKVIREILALCDARMIIADPSYDYRCSSRAWAYIISHPRFEQ
jgi:hypothetical protein